MSTAGIVLAAGFSRRLGRPKQELLLGGKTLLDRAVQSALAADLAPIYVVLNSAAKSSPAFKSPGCHVAFNSHAEEGLASSVRVGVKALLPFPQISGAVLMTCDQVLLTPAHLRRLCANSEVVTASAYGGKRGVPAYFPKRKFGDLLQLHGDAGARELLSNAHSIQAEDLLLDIDTEADVDRAKLLLTAGETTRDL